jgi:hypothetical protein
LVSYADLFSGCKDVYEIKPGIHAANNLMLEVALELSSSFRKKPLDRLCFLPHIVIDP